MIDAYLQLSTGVAGLAPASGCGPHKLKVVCSAKIDGVDHDMPEANSLEDAIRIACCSVTISHGVHGHQKRIPKVVRQEMGRRLLQQMEEISAAKDFSHLHYIIKMTTQEVPGAGALFCYDIALRIGAGWLRLLPEAVYLHAGARDGAKALGISGDVVSLSKFPPPIQRLSPAQAEAFLCIYKKELQSLRF